MKSNLNLQQSITLNWAVCVTLFSIQCLMACILFCILFFNFAIRAVLALVRKWLQRHMRSYSFTKMQMQCIRVQKEYFINFIYFHLLKWKILSFMIICFCYFVESFFLSVRVPFPPKYNTIFYWHRILIVIHFI